VAPVPVVKDLEVLEDFVGQVKPGVPLVAVSVCILAQNDSIIALSTAESTLPMDGMRPASRIRSLKTHEVNWLPWSEWSTTPGVG